MEQPSKRAQFVHGMRAYSAHNCLHVNAPTRCRFAQSYIIGSTRCGGSPWRRTETIFARTDRALRESRQDSFRCCGLQCSPANAAAFSQRNARAVTGTWPNIETGKGEETGTQFVPGRRAYSAHNRFHVNAPAHYRFGLSYIIHNTFGVRTNDQRPH
jgi:hypothetical protein